MSKPIRAALYARVSTSGHGQDVGLQLDELRQVATQRSWVASEFALCIDPRKVASARLGAYEAAGH